MYLEVSEWIFRGKRTSSFYNGKMLRRLSTVIFIKGAHYVGKSYLAEAFSRKEYASTSCFTSSGVSAADVGKTVLFCACLFLLR